MEAVLCALQERQLALAIKGPVINDPPNSLAASVWDDSTNKWSMTPIKWGWNLSPFPANGEITSLEQVISVLNVASECFDRIKAKYVAFDPNTNQLVNLTHTSPGSRPPTFVPTSSSTWASGEAWKLTVDPNQPNSPESNSYLTSFVTSGIKLPSVGRIDETNWQVKLRLLASNIEHLRALTWPVKYQAAIARFGREQWAGDDRWKYEKIVRNSNWTVDFPSLGYSDTESEGASYYRGVPFGESYPVHVNKDGIYLHTLAWTLHGESSVRVSAVANPIDDAGHCHNDFFLYCITGMLAAPTSIKPLTLPSGAPTLNGRFVLLRGPVVACYGDLAEKVVLDSTAPLPTPEKRLRLGALSPKPYAVAAGVNGRHTVGNYNLGFPEEIAWNYVPVVSKDPLPWDVITKEDAVNKACSLLNIKKPDIKNVDPAMSIVPADWGNIYKAAMIGVDKDNTPVHWEPYWFALDKGAQNRPAFGLWAPPAQPNGTQPPSIPMSSNNSLDIVSVTVFVPTFTKLYPEGALREPLLPSRAGEVELTVTDRELLRIHVGRGSKDINQYAWLGTRSDGFGSVKFYGAPDEFELLYEEDAAKFKDEPIGGRTFDTITELSDEQKLQSGWVDRFQYISEWFSPRLRQVKGGDVFVDIVYDNNSSYHKKLRFYWVNDVANKVD
ncbi:MAG: hypothetical protein V4710_02170, partial [Verrucomicrobiota bacterium]